MSTLLTILTILSSFLTNLETKTLQSDFTITVAEEVNAPMNFPGEIIMQGNKFRLEMMEIEAAYDGKTMYMYSSETEASQDGSQTIVTLTPKDQTIGINRFTLHVRNEDLMPLKVEIKEGKKTSTLKMKEPKFVTPQNEFVLKPGKDTYVNDMRL